LAIVVRILARHVPCIHRAPLLPEHPSRPVLLAKLL